MQGKQGECKNIDVLEGGNDLPRILVALVHLAHALQLEVASDIDDRNPVVGLSFRDNHKSKCQRAISQKSVSRGISYIKALQGVLFQNVCLEDGLGLHQHQRALGFRV